MGNLGAPVAYLVVSDGLPVYDPDGREVGRVARVLADDREDIFHGLIVRLPADRYRFADPSQLAGLYERGVTLAVPADQLHDPSEDPVAAGLTENDPVRTGLHRAWEWLNRPL